MDQSPNMSKKVKITVIAVTAILVSACFAVYFINMHYAFDINIVKKLVPVRTYYVKDTIAEVRSTSEEDSDIMLKLKQNTEVTADIEQEGWFRIKIAGSSDHGWMHVSVLSPEKVVPAPPKPKPVIKKKKQVKEKALPKKSVPEPAPPPAPKPPKTPEEYKKAYEKALKVADRYIVVQEIHILDRKKMKKLLPDTISVKALYVPDIEAILMSAVDDKEISGKVYEKIVTETWLTFKEGMAVPVRRFMYIREGEVKTGSNCDFFKFSGVSGGVYQIDVECDKYRPFSEQVKLDFDTKYEKKILLDRSGKK